MNVMCLLAVICPYHSSRNVNLFFFRNTVNVTGEINNRANIALDADFRPHSHEKGRNTFVSRCIFSCVSDEFLQSVRFYLNCKGLL